MKNIVNIMKYNFKTLKILYFIELIILIISLVTGRFISMITWGWDIVALVGIVCTINFIASLILFSCQISKEYGRLLFLTEIKGVEFIIGSLLQLVSVNLLSLLLIIIVNLIGIGVVSAKILLVIIGIYIGFTVAYLIITSLIGIVYSYIKNSFFVVITTILVAVIGSFVYEVITSYILGFLPYVYMTIGNNNAIEIDIIEWILGLIVIIGLQIVLGNSIDKKLDIV